MNERLDADWQGIEASRALELHGQKNLLEHKRNAVSLFDGTTHSVRRYGPIADDRFGDLVHVVRRQRL